MVVCKGVQHAPPVYSAILIELSPDGMGDLEVIVRLMSGPKSLVQLIVCDRMKHLRICPARIVTVDHLSHQPEIRFFLQDYAAHLPKEIKIKAVRTIQPDAVNIKRINPETNHIKQVVLHLRISEVQVDQIARSSPRLIGKPVVISAVPAKIDALVPVLVSRLLPILLDIPKCKKITSCMVEDSIDDHPDSCLMTGAYKCLEIFLISKTSVHHPVIDCVVPMPG